MSLLPNERCSELVNEPGMYGGFHPHQCHKRATITQKGKHYCKIHDPEYIKQKDKTREQKYQETWTIRKIELSGPLLLKACKEAYEISNDPRVKAILAEAINKAA